MSVCDIHHFPHAPSAAGGIVHAFVRAFAPVRLQVSELTVQVQTGDARPASDLEGCSTW